MNRAVSQVDISSVVIIARIVSVHALLTLLHRSESSWLVVCELGSIQLGLHHRISIILLLGLIEGGDWGLISQATIEILLS